MKPKLLTPLTEDQKACIDLLEELLTDARDGLITSLATVVVVQEGTFASNAAGRQLGTLNLGLDSLKKRFLDVLEGRGGGRIITS